MPEDTSWIARLIGALERQREVAEEILDRSRKVNRTYLSNEDDVLAERWRDLTSVHIRDLLGKIEWRRFLEVTKAGYPPRSEAFRLGRGLDHVRHLLQVARNYPDQLTFSEPASSAMRKLVEEAEALPAQVGRTVFIIHGRDELNTLRLDKLLRERFAQQTKILWEQPGKSRTIIEKFEQEAASCGFAFALLTPDDFIKLESGEYAQARPNAVFELGWFCGHIGRDRTCILMKSGTHIHSDLAGVNRIDFNESVLEKLGEIERELHAAGLVEATDDAVGK